MPRPRRNRSDGSGGGGAATPPSPVELAIRYLTPRRRFEREVRAHLRKKGIAPSDVDEAIVRLEELGLVDDEGTTRAWIRDRMNFAPRGRGLLRIELRRQGVSETVVESALAEIVDPEQELEAALVVVRKAGRRGGDSSGPDAARRRRLWGALARRGFDPDVCREALRRHFDEEYESVDPGSSDEVVSPGGDD